MPIIAKFPGGMDKSKGLTATAKDILMSKTALVGGNIITGTIPLKATAIYTPSQSNQIITGGQFLSGEQTILGDSNLIASNIKNGCTIFGVKGTFTGHVLYYGWAPSGENIGIEVTNSSTNTAIKVIGKFIYVWGYTEFNATTDGQYNSSGTFCGNGSNGVMTVYGEKESGCAKRSFILSYAAPHTILTFTPSLNNIQDGIQRCFMYGLKED